MVELLKLMLRILLPRGILKISGAGNFCRGKAGESRNFRGKSRPIIEKHRNDE